jgi:phosphatidylglycerophosphate synthase
MRHRLAHAVTGIRLALLPVWIWCWHLGSGWSIVLMAVMIASDMADGALARRLGTASAAGAKFDALSDFAVILAAAVAMGARDPRFLCLGGVAAASFGSWFLRRKARAAWLYTRYGKYNGAVCYAVLLSGCCGTWSVCRGPAWDWALGIMPWMGVAFMCMSALLDCMDGRRRVRESDAWPGLR